MAVNNQPVLKRCRALGLDPAFLGVTKKSKKQPRSNGRKLSEYGLQKNEKQKVKFIYGVLEKPFRNYFEKASKMRGITGENLLRLLECRLDNTIYRLGYGRTRKEARQLVRQCHFTVNGKKVNIPSYSVSVGDKIEVKEKSRGLDKFKIILESTGSKIIPKWLIADHDNLTGEVVALPLREDIDAPIEETLIVELYSK